MRRLAVSSRFSPSRRAGIKIDKVTVWDGAGSKDGKTATSNFISGMMQSVPPLNDLFRMAGLNLPDYLKGKADVQENKEETNN